MFKHIFFFSYKNCIDLNKGTPLTKVSATEIRTETFLTEILISVNKTTPISSLIGINVIDHVSKDLYV